LVVQNNDLSGADTASLDICASLSYNFSRFDPPETAGALHKAFTPPAEVGAIVARLVRLPL
jgi:hypothetical protein